MSTVSKSSVVVVAIIAIAGLAGAQQGDITAVRAGDGLTGGGDSGDVTLSVAVPFLLTDSQASKALVFANNTHAGDGSCAFRGIATGNGPVANYGGWFVSYGDSGRGVFGDSRGDQGSGVFGIGRGEQATGVAGEYRASFDEVRGHGYVGSRDYGVAGFHDGSTGVHGQSTRGTGVEGRSFQGTGVRGTSIDRAGVYGTSTQQDGVYGYSTAGIGVHGVAGPNAVAAGVFDGRVVVEELEITGGADLAERFPVRRPADAIQLRPGMVVSIDADNPGGLAVSDRAYDRRVAGIISGAGGLRPAVVMAEDDPGETGLRSVALSGRVHCLADSSGGPIRPGDLLTTSTRPGHAMRVTDVERAQGAILGKAMSALDGDSGLVLVLVNLQ